METVTPLQAPGRLHHLDGLRGIAALTVAVLHVNNCFKSVDCAWYLDLLMAQTPVLFFFLLSGCVLGRSLEKKGALSVKGVVAYMIRRVFRLYPITLVSVLFAAVLIGIVIRIAVPTDSMSGLMVYILGNAQSVTGSMDFLREILLKDNFFNPPVWTIKVELICSILLPFVVALVNRNRFLSIATGLLLAFLLWRGDVSHYRTEIRFGYLFIFYLGYLSYSLAPRIDRFLGAGSRPVLLALCVLLLVSMWFRCGLVIESLLLAALFSLLVTCRWEILRSVLTSPPIQFLGRISFSLYLLHLPIIFLCFALLSKNLPSLLFATPPVLRTLLPHWPGVLVLGVFALIPSMVLASYTERSIERFFNTLGHRLASLLAPRGTGG